jgi:hypothetical protein
MINLVSISKRGTKIFFQNCFIFKKIFFEGANKFGGQDFLNKFFDISSREVAFM